MKAREGTLQLSATDLATFSGCRHATALELGVLRKERAGSGWFNPMVAALRERGLEHERRYVQGLRERGLSVLDLSSQRGSAGYEATLAALRAGTQVIVQATLERAPWTGIVDLLLRRETPSALGAWSYVPVDTKLATDTRAATLLQLSLYAELLRAALGRLPDELGVVAPGDAQRPWDEQWYAPRDFDAYFRRLREQMLAATREPPGALESRIYPEPVEHCNVCKWWESCDARRHDDDHLSLVAGASRAQRRELESREVRTLAALARTPLPLWKPSRGSREALESTREQARVQLEGRERSAAVHELLPLVSGQGLTRLPAPSAGDVFFDLEGDPFASGGGREYLFGFASRDRDGKGDWIYEACWACTRAEERDAFEKVVGFFDRRALEHPGFHIYHFGSYDRDALKRLMGRHGVLEDEVDRLLRAERFVDLHRITKQSVRASVEQYSIKDLERFYGFSRDMDLRIASQGRRSIEKAIEAGEWAGLTADVKSIVERYNRDDCLSARALRDWLEELRAEHEANGHAVPRPEPRAAEPEDKAAAKAHAVRQLMTRLLATVPDDPGVHTEEQRARWLLAQELEYHHRESKSEWWSFYRMRDLSDAELLDEGSALTGLTFVERLPRKSKRQKVEIDRYTYPPQECDLRAYNDLKLPGSGDAFGEILAIDRERRIVEIKKKQKTAELHPSSVFEFENIGAATLADSLLRIAQDVVESGLGDRTLFAAARDLLSKHAPRVVSGAFAARAGESTLDFARRVVLELDRSVLPIQGPPGAGKTYTAARMICTLVRAGKKVGITAPSHKVLQKLLGDVVRAAAEEGVPARCLAKVSDEPDPSLPFAQEEDAKTVVQALRDGEYDVVGGTAWLWAREDAQSLVDVLFVDEAGQMSLANTLAVAPAAQSLVLVGDPRQLQQPLKGSHPDGVAVSALEHLLHEHATVPADRGIFLAETFRLAPSLCTFTSESFYEGRLSPRPGLERQCLQGTTGFDGAGLWYLPVSHDGNQSSSPEEAQAVTEVIDRLLVPDAKWIDANGEAHPLGPEHVLVVAPYNAQVSLLLEQLRTRRIKVGTVDKFQGQEAPIVIYCMATSAPDDAPRGMEFLYSLHRLNVASSRARCACILVASPALLSPDCRSVEQLRLANAFCRYLEQARTPA